MALSVQAECARLGLRHKASHEEVGLASKDMVLKARIGKNGNAACSRSRCIRAHRARLFLRRKKHKSSNKASCAHRSKGARAPPKGVKARARLSAKARPKAKAAGRRAVQQHPPGEKQAPAGTGAQERERRAERTKRTLEQCERPLPVIKRDGTAATLASHSVRRHDGWMETRWIVERLLDLRLGGSSGPPQTVSIPVRLADTDHYIRVLTEVVACCAESLVFFQHRRKRCASDFTAQAFRLRSGVAWLLMLPMTAEPPTAPALVILSRPGCPESGSSFVGITEPRDEGIGIRTKADPQVWCDTADVLVLDIQLSLLARQLRAISSTPKMKQAFIDDLLIARAHFNTPAARSCGAWAQQLDSAQLRDVQAACELDEGFALIADLSSLRTATDAQSHSARKAAALLALLNGLHLCETRQLFKSLEEVAFAEPSQRKEKWAVAMMHLPCIMILATSDAAADEIMQALCGEGSGLLDANGAHYCPEAVRVREAFLLEDALRERDPVGVSPKDVDRQVYHWSLYSTRVVEEDLLNVRRRLCQDGNLISSLSDDLRMLRAVVPLPIGWEARISRHSTGNPFPDVVYHDHMRRTASWDRPPRPAPGEPCVGFLDLPEAVSRLDVFMKAVASYRELQTILTRYLILRARHTIPDDAFRSRLRAHAVGSAEIIVTTLDTVVAAPHSTWGRRVSSLLVCGASRVPEASVLVAVQAVQARRCVLVNDECRPIVAGGDGSLYGRLLQQRKNYVPTPFDRTMPTSISSGAPHADGRGGIRPTAGPRDSGRSDGACDAPPRKRAHRTVQKPSAQSVLPRWALAGPVPIFPAPASDAD